MGEFWLGPAFEVVIQGDFDGFIDAKAALFSGGQFDFVDQTLDGSGGNSSFRAVS